jgi:hypothetical protein
MENSGIRRDRYSSIDPLPFFCAAAALLEKSIVFYICPAFVTRSFNIHAMPLNTDEMWNSVYYMEYGGDTTEVLSVWVFIHWTYRIDDKFTQSTDILLIYVPYFPGYYDRLHVN